jgi:hypothetical protein
MGWTDCGHGQFAKHITLRVIVVLTPHGIEVQVEVRKCDREAENRDNAYAEQDRTSDEDFGEPSPPWDVV